MTNYNAELIEVVDGSDTILKVEIEINVFEDVKFRLEGVQTPEIQKHYHTSLNGALGLQFKYTVAKWFSEHSENINIDLVGKDICGRWLGVLYAEGEAESLNTFLINLYANNNDWNIAKQEELKDDWFEGEEVTIPNRDKLPIFRNWGKPVFLGPVSVQFNR